MLKKTQIPGGKVVGEDLSLQAGSTHKPTKGLRLLGENITAEEETQRLKCGEEPLPVIGKNLAQGGGPSQ